MLTTQRESLPTTQRESMPTTQRESPCGGWTSASLTPGQGTFSDVLQRDRRRHGGERQRDRTSPEDHRQYGHPSCWPQQQTGGSSYRAGGDSSNSRRDTRGNRRHDVRNDKRHDVSGKNGSTNARNDTRRDTRGDWQHDDRSDTRDVTSTEAGSTTTTITQVHCPESGAITTAPTPYDWNEVNAWHTSVYHSPPLPGTHSRRKRHQASQPALCPYCSSTTAAVRRN